MVVGGYGSQVQDGSPRRGSGKLGDHGARYVAIGYTFKTYVIIIIRQLQVESSLEQSMTP